jgi:hypothetical protein
MTGSPSPEERLDGLGFEEVEPKANGQDEQKNPRALKLIFPRDISNDGNKPWIHKNVMAKGEISSWIGKPKAAKSSLLTDIGFHAARGIGWRGYVNKGACGVVYFALERAKLVERRLTAHCQRDAVESDNLANLPFAVCPRIIDLMNEQCVEIIVDTVKAAEDRFGIGVGMITIDTFSKGIAAGGGDEDKARDQNKVNANMRRVLERIEVHIASIGHTGKDPAKGERGSNARLADVDLLVVITGDDFKLAMIEMANDQPAGRLTAFALEPIELGRDDDGDPIRTFIVSREIANDAASRAGARQKLSDRQTRAIRALADAINNIGQPCSYAPFGTQAVTETQWEAELVSQSVLDPKAANPRTRYTELRDSLATRYLIGLRNTFVWLL